MVKAALKTDESVQYYADCGVLCVHLLAGAQNPNLLHTLIQTVIDLGTTSWPYI